MSYPFSPGYQAHSETSRYAAENLHDAAGQMADVIDAFRMAGSDGLTGDEVTRILRRTRPMIENGTVAARMTRLKAEQVIVMKGEQRQTARNRSAEVWIHRAFAAPEVIDLWLQQPVPKRELSRDVINTVADFLAELVDRRAFAVPLLYEKAAKDYEAKLRKIAGDMKR